eukprot:2408683-Rhodomonas_salina.2
MSISAEYHFLLSHTPSQCYPHTPRQYQLLLSPYAYYLPLVSTSSRDNRTAASCAMATCEEAAVTCEEGGDARDQARATCKEGGDARDLSRLQPLLYAPELHAVLSLRSLQRLVAVVPKSMTRIDTLSTDCATKALFSLFFSSLFSSAQKRLAGPGPVAARPAARGPRASRTPGTTRAPLSVSDIT